MESFQGQPPPQAGPAENCLKCHGTVSVKRKNARTLGGLVLLGGKVFVTLQSFVRLKLSKNLQGWSLVQSYILVAVPSFQTGQSLQYHMPRSRSSVVREYRDQPQQGQTVGGAKLVGSSFSALQIRSCTFSHVLVSGVRWQ